MGPRGCEHESYLRWSSQHKSDLQWSGEQELDSRGGLVQEGVLVKSVGREAVEGTRLHGDPRDQTVSPICQVEGLQHPEAWNKAWIQASECGGGRWLKLCSLSFTRWCESIDVNQRACCGAKKTLISWLRASGSFFRAEEEEETDRKWMFHRWRWSGFLWWCWRHQSRPPRRRVCRWVCCWFPAAPQSPHLPRPQQKRCNLKKTQPIRAGALIYTTGAKIKLMVQPYELKPADVQTI